MSDNLVALKLALDGSAIVNAGLATTAQRLDALQKSAVALSGAGKVVSVSFGQLGGILAAFGSTQLAAAVTGIEGAARVTRELNHELGKSKSALVALGAVAVGAGVGAGMVIGDLLAGPGERQRAEKMSYLDLLRSAQDDLLSLVSREAAEQDKINRSITDRLQRLRNIQGLTSNQFFAVSTMLDKLREENRLKIVRDADEQIAQERAKANDTYKQAITSLTDFESAEAKRRLETNLAAIDAQIQAIHLLRELQNESIAFHNEQQGKVGAEQIRYDEQKSEIQRLLIGEQEKNELLEAAEYNHQLKLSQIHQQGEDERLEAEKLSAQRKLQISQDYLHGSADIFGSLAEIAKLYGSKGFKAWKAFALAQAVISGAGAVLLQLGSGDPYSAPFRAIAAGVAAAAQIATIAATQPSGGYLSGGYTGDGSPTSVAGDVHRREFVFSAPATQAIGVSNLAALHDAARSGSAVNVGGSNVNLAFINTNSDYRRFLETDPGAEKWVIDMVNKNKFRLGIA
jgi:hypothetical protein